MSIIFIERALTNSPHLFIETVWPCYTVPNMNMKNHLALGLLKDRFLNKVLLKRTKPRRLYFAKLYAQILFFYSN